MARRRTASSNNTNTRRTARGGEPTGRPTRSATEQRLLSTPWVCNVCTFEGNTPSRTICSICNSPRFNHLTILQALLADLEGRGGEGGTSGISVTTTNGGEGRLTGEGEGREVNANFGDEIERWDDINLQLALLLSATQAEVQIER